MFETTSIIILVVRLSCPVLVMILANVLITGRPGWWNWRRHRVYWEKAGSLHCLPLQVCKLSFRELHNFIKFSISMVVLGKTQTLPNFLLSFFWIRKHAHHGWHVGLRKSGQVDKFQIQNTNFNFFLQIEIFFLISRWNLVDWPSIPGDSWQSSSFTGELHWV